MNATRWVLVVLVVTATLGSPGVGAAAADEDCSFPVTRTDATGTAVTIAEDPDTVVTLNPSAAQTMYEIGAWDEVIGVSTFADYLPGADEKTTVGSGTDDATVERTIALDPDLVLAPNTIEDSETVEQLRDAGLTVYLFEAAEDLDDIEAKTRLTGEFVGHCADADDRADEFARQVDLIEDAVDDVDRPAVFYTFFGFTAGSDTFIHEVIETAGGDNIAADDADINANGAATSGFFAVNSEIVVDTDPAWFVLNRDEYDTAEVPAGPGGVYEGTTAYEEGNAVVLNADEISQPAPRIVDAIVDLVRVLHPDAYESEIAGRIDPDPVDGERRVAAERLADGSLSLQADNIGRDDAVSFAVPARPNATVDVRRLNITLATVNPTFELRVRPAGDRAAPTDTRALDAMAVSGNGIFARDIDHVTLRFAVNRSHLGGADPETVTLYRANESGWTPLRTTRVNTTNDTVVYEARATGMPTLLVAVDEPRPASPGTNTTPTPTATATATATAAPTATTTPTATPTPTPGSAPGFGPVVALAAILLVARGWRR